MNPTPLQLKIAEALCRRGCDPAHAVKAADDVLQVIADASPAEVIEEGGYLLGASHMWADTQGTKATEHMVRRITGPDVVKMGRMQAEIDGLRAFKRTVDEALNSGDGTYRP